jgi:hypothetical protein
MKSRFWSTIALIACSALLASISFAQDASKKIMPTGHFNGLTAAERTPEQMDAFAATFAAPAAAKSIPFNRPTIDMATYKALKQQAAANAMASVINRASSSAPLPPNSPIIGSKFAGPKECDTGSGCWFPPDSNGSIGKSQFVSVDNDIYAVYSKTGGLLKEVSLNAFFGYSAQPMFDPRVEYDETWGRWIVTADAFPESSTKQILGIAISKTTSATGGFFIYLINVNVFGGAGSFYDFPMLGLGQDAVIFTANVFGPSSFLGSSLFSVAKARLYNGLGWSVPIFTGLVATMQPSHQLTADQSAFPWLAAAPPNNNTLFLINVEFPASPSQTFLNGYYTVPVGSYSVPAGAVQLSCGGGANALDTGDNRFVNAGYQDGDRLYQANSVFSLATGQYYIIQGLSSFSPSLAQIGAFFGNGNSSDFNVSIAADSSNRMVLNWTSSSPTAYFAQERFAGRLDTDPAISGAAGTVLLQSPTCLTGNFDSNFGEQRWGDYSKASVDPSTAKTFWIINETIPNSSSWGTEVGKIHF